MNVVIHFDGGSVPNPGEKYGSFSIVVDGQCELSMSRIKFGYGTNNEAEFNALIAALDLLEKTAANAGVPLKTLVVEIYTDSRIVFNWLKAKPFNVSSIKEERRRAMGELTMKCRAVLDRCQSFVVEWNSRSVNVEKFGH